MKITKRKIFLSVSTILLISGACILFQNYIVGISMMVVSVVVEMIATHKERKELDNSIKKRLKSN